MRRIGIALLLAAAGLSQDVSRMDQAVQSYVSDKKFMGSVLVARGGEVLLSKGYGSANLEWNIPNAPTTKFRLGSVTKQFTAATILLLEQRGKLKTDDPVKKFMPDAPATWDKITIFHLLTHTSGIPSFTGFPDYASQEPFATTPEKLVARFRDPDGFVFRSQDRIFRCVFAHAAQNLRAFLPSGIATTWMSESGLAISGGTVGLLRQKTKQFLT